MESEVVGLRRLLLIDKQRVAYQ